MNVLHICTDFWPATGGIEHFVLELAQQTARLGVSPSVLCHRKPRGSIHALPKHDTVEGVPITRVPCLDLKYYKPTWLPMQTLRAADLIHVHGIGAPLDGVALTQPLHRRPIVVSTHGGIFHTDKVATLKQWYFHHIVPRSGRRVSVFLADSKNDFRLFNGVVDRVQLLENGVTMPPTVEVPRQHDRLLHVGRLSENKQVDKLIAAFAHLRKLGSRATLRLVGPDWSGNGATLRALAYSLGVRDAVTFVGEVSAEQLPIEYASAGWLVSASRFEGFGLSIIEGMSAGCLPVVNRIAAFADIIRDGHDGFLVNFDEPHSAAILLNELLAAPPPPQMVEAARETAKAFTWERKAPLFVEHYHATLRNNGVHA